MAFRAARAQPGNLPQTWFSEVSRKPLAYLPTYLPTCLPYLAPSAKLSVYTCTENDAKGSVSWPPKSSGAGTRPAALFVSTGAAPMEVDPSPEHGVLQSGSLGEGEGRAGEGRGGGGEGREIAAVVLLILGSLGV